MPPNIFRRAKPADDIHNFLGQQCPHSSSCTAHPAEDIVRSALTPLAKLLPVPPRFIAINHGADELCPLGYPIQRTIIYGYPNIDFQRRYAALHALTLRNLERRTILIDGDAAMVRGEVEYKGQECVAFVVFSRWRYAEAIPPVLSDRDRDNERIKAESFEKLYDIHEHDREGTVFLGVEEDNCELNCRFEVVLANDIQGRLDVLRVSKKHRDQGAS